MTESAEHRIETAQVRHAPRYAVFLVAGGALGLIVAMILTFAFDGTASPSPTTAITYSTSQVFGFLALICITVGLAVGGVVALILDRTLSRRAREVRIDHERVEVLEADDPTSE